MIPVGLRILEGIAADLPVGSSPMSLMMPLLLLALLGPAGANDLDPEQLVLKLGAPRFRDREEAATAIERLGKSALPALRRAREDPDAEIRARVGVLYEKIESTQLTVPTEIRLDVNGRTMEEVLKGWHDAEGLNIQALLTGDPAWARRPLQIESAEPLPFWTALDRLCQAGQARSTLSFQPTLGRREPSLAIQAQLADGAYRPAGLVSDHGPFRVVMTGLNFRRDISFGVPSPSNAPPGGMKMNDLEGVAGVTLREQCQATIQIMAEPRMAMVQAGLVRLIEATDEKGQSWKPADVKLPVMQMPNAFGGGGVPMLQLMIPLSRPVQPGTSLKKLRGAVPVMLSSRKPEPLEVLLAGANGKIARSDDVQLTIHEVKANPEMASSTIEVSIARTNPGPNEAIQDFRMDANNSQQMELLDERGEVLSWFPSGMQADGEGVRVTMTVPTRGPNSGAPAKLRYFGMVRTSAEIPFEFEVGKLP